jgi:hypothetical protein
MVDQEYEIMVYEYNSPYDSETVTQENCVEVFLKICKKYVSPEYLREDQTHVHYGNWFFSYADQSGGDKPMLVMLIGPKMTAGLISEIKAGLKELYNRLCEQCQCNINTEDKMWALCHTCRDM